MVGETVGATIDECPDVGVEEAKGERSSPQFHREKRPRDELSEQTVDPLWFYFMRYNRVIQLLRLIAISNLPLVSSNWRRLGGVIR